jgi:hypothetical protein
MWDKSGLSDNWLLNDQGYLQKAVDATSLDGTMTIQIPLGAKIVDADGKPLTQISVTPIAPPDDAPEDYQILKSFNFNPDGAEFYPGMTITISVDTAEVADGETLVLAFYNETNSCWEFIFGVDNGDGTATFTLNHFSVYSLMSGSAGGLPMSIWIWVLIAIGTLMILLVAILLGRRLQTAKA